MYIDVIVSIPHVIKIAFQFGMNFGTFKKLVV